MVGSEFEFGSVLVTGELQPGLQLLMLTTEWRLILVDVDMGAGCVVERDMGGY